MASQDSASLVEMLRTLIISRAVEFNVSGFILASGRKSNLYIDLRRLTQDPQGINLVGELMLNKIEQLAPGAGYVGGLETASIPISTAVSLLSLKRKKQLRAFWVRKRQKDHGLGNRIEGNLEPGCEVVILDDTVTTGGSSIQAIKAVIEAGSKVVQSIAVVDRGAKEAFDREGVPFFSFFTESDLFPK